MNEFLSCLNFNNKKLVNSVLYEELYTQIYTAVRLNGGCTCSGEDIIAEQANKLYSAVRGGEYQALLQAAGVKDGDALKFLAQRGIRAEDKAFIKKGVFSRHNLKSIAEEEAKRNNDGAELLFFPLSRTRRADKKGNNKQRAKSP
ncbi:MAG TPA: hypothetical protein VGU44_04475 [Gammaproteobacteria bacterium]|nr:hypothetical protein [Gammaproteobacteria bacterium]